MNRQTGRTRAWWVPAAAAAWIVVTVAALVAASADLAAPRWAGLARALGALALLALMLGAAYGWGLLILRALLGSAREDVDAHEPVWALGLGFGFLWSATFVVAALHLLGVAWAWVLLGSGWLALALQVRRRPRLRVPDVRGWSTARWFLLLVMVASVGYSVVGWALVPPLAWDEVSYHLPIPQMLIDAGGFVSIPTIVHSNWPSGMEVLNTLALLLGSELLPHLIVTAMVVATAVALVRFSSRWLDDRTGWLAAALYLSMSLVKSHAGIALIEGALGFFGVLAIWAAYEWLERNGWRRLAVAAVLGGLAASIKLTGAGVPIAVGTTALAWLLLFRRQPVAAAVTRFAAYGLIALAVVAPWYAKSALYTGNPVWPFLFDVLGGRTWDALGDEWHTAWLHRPNMALTLGNYLSGPWQITVRPLDFGGRSMGAAPLVLAPVSLFFAARRPRLLAYLIPVTTIVYTFWFLATHQIRFLAAIAPILALLAAWACVQVCGSWPRWAAALARVAMLVYLAGTLSFLRTDEWTVIRDSWRYVSGSTSRHDFLSERVPGYDAFDVANRELPADARVLLAVWETRGYYLERPVIWANPLSQRVIRWEALSSTGELADALASLGITHIFWNRTLYLGGIPHEQQIDELLSAFVDESGELLYAQDGYELYAIDTAR